MWAYAFMFTCIIIIVLIVIILFLVFRKSSITSSFTFSPKSPVVGTEITFKNTSKNAKTYYWRFGDGTESTLVNPTHYYAKSGTYQIQLIAFNEFEAVLSTQHIIVADTDITSSFTYKPENIAIINIPTDFTNTSTGATSYLWNFGDGVGSSTLTNPKYTYTKTGNFTITLTAINGDKKVISTKPISVYKNI